MDEHFSLAIVGHDEAETLARIVELDRALDFEGKPLITPFRVRGAVWRLIVPRGAARDRRDIDAVNVRNLRASTTLHDLTGHRRALRKRIVSRRLHDGCVAEDIGGTVLRLQEPVTLRRHEPFYKRLDPAPG